MAATTVAKVLKRRWELVAFLGAVLAATLLHGADPNTNTGYGKVVLVVDFEGKTTLGWSLLEGGGAQGALRIEVSPISNSSDSNSLQLVVTKVGERCGIKFSGEKVTQVQSNQWYDLTFRARTEKRENDRGYGLTVSIESRDGKQICARTTLPEVGGDWRDYTVALHSRLPHADGTLIITMSEPGIIWFDEVKLTQRPTGREMQTP